MFEFLRKKLFALSSEYLTAERGIEIPAFIPREGEEKLALINILPWLKDANEVHNENGPLSNSQRRFIYYMPWLERLPKDFKTLLDVGCGEGYASAFFYNRGHKVTAIDPAASFKFGDNLTFINKNLEDLPETMKFDAIFMSHVMEHIFNIGNFMELVKGKLMEDGYFIVILYSQRINYQDNIKALYRRICKEMTR
jgi:2-polyprenyl-3-methyl-5-hydroxy-6-metoxy-1,4-benzoquinol methylase